jgi:hypothetical protein
VLRHWEKREWETKGKCGGGEEKRAGKERKTEKEVEKKVENGWKKRDRKEKRAVER